MHTQYYIHVHVHVINASVYLYMHMSIIGQCIEPTYMYLNVHVVALMALTVMIILYVSYIVISVPNEVTMSAFCIDGINPSPACLQHCIHLVKHVYMYMHVLYMYMYMYMYIHTLYYILYICTCT